MAMNTRTSPKSARRLFQGNRSGWPMFVAVVLSSLPALALEPLYGGLSIFEVNLARDSVQITLENVPSQETRRWSLANGQTRGSVTPLRTFKIKTGHYCREFREKVSSATNGLQSADQIACRNDAGQWVRIDP